jgi:hypothetical protein
MEEKETQEAAENYANKKGHIPTTELEDAIFKQGFLDGAKWQAERMYSEEDLNIMFDTLKKNSVDNISTITNVDLFIKSWKREFKKE